MNAVLNIKNAVKERKHDQQTAAQAISNEALEAMKNDPIQLSWEIRAPKSVRHINKSVLRSAIYDSAATLSEMIGRRVEVSQERKLFRLYFWVHIPV